jgi:hypothetical protein
MIDKKATLTVVGVFILFASLFLLIQFAGPQLSSHEDPAYHLGHAVSYITGEAWHFPVYSTMTTHYVDHYYLYHRALALFIDVFQFDIAEYASLIEATKIFHSLLSALFFVVFFLTLDTIVLQEATSLRRNSVLLISCIMTLLLFVAIPSFTYRLYLYRPHIISMVLVLFSIRECYRRSVIGVALTSFLAPLFYSLALIVLIPSFFYAVASMLYNGFAATWKRSTRLFLVACCSLGLGIAIRPDSFAYVYNALYIQLFVLYNYFFQGIDRVGELLPEVNDNIRLKFLVFVFALFCFVVYARIRTVGIKQVLPFGAFYLFVLSQALFIPMIFISRMSEYAIPAVFLFLTTVFAAVGIPFFQKVLKCEYDRVGSGGGPNIVVVKVRRLIEQIICVRKPLFFGLVLFILLGLLSTTLFFRGLLQAEVKLDLYTGAAEFLRDHSEEGDIVFLQRADMYPQLALNDQKNFFTVGMADTFTYAYDPKIYWLWKHITKGEMLCYDKVCERSEMEMYDALKNIFKVKFVFIDKRTGIGGHVIDDTVEFVRLLQNGVEYEKVFVDPRYPEIEVFKLL